MGRVELGMVLLQQGEIEAARKCQEEAVRLAAESTLKPGAAQALFQLGEIALVSGDLAQARRHHDEAIAIRREMKETRTIRESQLALAVLTLEEGRAADADRQAQQVVAGFANTTASFRTVAEIVTARARIANRDLPGAAQALASARQSSTERVAIRAGVAMVQAEPEAAHGRTREARERLAALEAEHVRAGLVLLELERRLLLLRIVRGAGGSRVEARDLEKDARTRGAGLIARRAQSL